LDKAVVPGLTGLAVAYAKAFHEVSGGILFTEINSNAKTSPSSINALLRVLAETFELDLPPYSHIKAQLENTNPLQVPSPKKGSTPKKSWENVNWRIIA
jgi:hypothetical protein